MIVSLIFLVYFEFDFSSYFEKPELFEIKDECSLIMGKLVHQIGNDGACKTACLGECEIRGLKFESFELSRPSDCYLCKCYCN